MAFPIHEMPFVFKTVGGFHNCTLQDLWVDPQEARALVFQISNLAPARYRMVHIEEQGDFRFRAGQKGFVE